MKKMLLIGALALMSVGCGQAKPYRVRRGLAYGPESNQLFDHYRPVGSHSGLAPVMIAIHGGAWQGGGRQGFGEEVAERFCPQGYDVLAVDYRLAPQHRWPAQFDDISLAVAYVHSAGAALGIDPRRIGLFGHSAGGQLAALVHLRSKGDTVCAVSAAGEGDLRVYGTVKTMGDEDNILAAVLGEENKHNPALLADMSPSAFVREDASIMLVHAVGDSNVCVDQSRRFYQALRDAGARDAWYVEVGGSNHNSIWKEGGRWNAIKGFANARLGPERPNFSAEALSFEAEQLVR